MPAVQNWVSQGDFASIVKIATRQKRILSLLTALTYDSDPLASDRAVEASGLAAKQIAQQNPEYVRNYLLRLFWLVNDESGGICWRAPELIGEILYNCPQFNQFHPMLISLLDLEKEDSTRFRVGTLWALGRVSQVVGDKMLSTLTDIEKGRDNRSKRDRARG